MLAVDLRDGPRCVVERAQLGLAARPLERCRQERCGVADEVVDGAGRRRAVLLLDRLERDADREGRIDRDRDRQAGHVRGDPLKR